MSEDPSILQFEIGYNGWVIMSKPKNINYINKNGQTGEQSYLTSFSDIGNEDIIILQVNSASITKSVNVPTINAYYLPFQTDDQDQLKEVKSLIRTGYGTATFSGSIDFDMTYGALKLLDVSSKDALDFQEDVDYGNMFKRNSVFHVQFFDGQNTCTVYNCVWNSFSINCQANSLVTCSLSFQSNNGYCEDLLIDRKQLKPVSSTNDAFEFDENDLLIPYWQTGREVKEENKKVSQILTQFNISFQRNVQSVFLNNIWRTPSYLKPGLISVNMNMTYADYMKKDDFFENNSNNNDSDKNELQIYIGNQSDHGKIITFNNAVLMNNAYNMSSMSDVGEKTYTWNSIRLNNTNPLFKIEDV